MIITKYQQFNESIKSLLVGPTDDEVLDSLKNEEPNVILMKSVNSDFLPGVKYALENGANVNFSDLSTNYLNDLNSTYDYFGICSPLSRSVMHNNIEISEYLLDNGADIDFNSGKCLRNASSRGDYKMVKFLLENDADIDLTDGISTALDDAISEGHTDVAELLLYYKNNDRNYISKPIKESIKHLLVGPTKEEVWKNLGLDGTEKEVWKKFDYDITFDTP